MARWSRTWPAGSSRPSGSTRSRVGPPFVGSDRGWILLLTARTFGGRPSAYLGPIAPLVGLLVDEALALRLWQEGHNRPTSPPDPEVLGAGARYEGPDDWGVPLFDDAKAIAAREAFRARLSEETKVH